MAGAAGFTGSAGDGKCSGGWLFVVGLELSCEDEAESLAATV
jgi:hypothetical protein